MTLDELDKFNKKKKQIEYYNSNRLKILKYQESYRNNKKNKNTIKSISDKLDTINDILDQVNKDILNIGDNHVDNIVDSIVDVPVDKVKKSRKIQNVEYKKYWFSIKHLSKDERKIKLGEYWKNKKPSN